MAGLRKIIDGVLNPGVRLVFWHSISYRLFRIRYLRWLALLVWNAEVSIHGCHISIKCKLPNSTRLPHPIGIVIGDGVILGEQVTIYQNVTVGLKKMGSESYPVLGDRVVIYAGAVIVGGVCLCDDAVVPANRFMKE